MNFTFDLQRRVLATLAAAGLMLAACGGGSDSDSSATVAPGTDEIAAEPSGATDPEADAPAEPVVTEAQVEDEPAEPVVTEAPTDDEGGGFEPGDAVFRAFNALDRPVDLYVRTTGLVKAFPIQSGLAPGAVSEFVAPPEGGSFVVTEAGAGNPTCVTGCDHFVTILSALSDSGPTYTAVLHDDEFSGAGAIDLWEEPEPGREGTSNAMPPPDPSTALGVITAIAVTDADFGLRLAFDGVEGCIAPVGDGNILIGGNQTPAFAFGPQTSFTLHDSQDRECSEAVGGPFEFAGAPGSRHHIFLTGAPGSLDAFLLPMVAGAPGAVTPPAEDDGSRDVAVQFIQGDLITEFGLDDEQATCAAELVVEGIGTDVLVVDGEVVDLDQLGESAVELAGNALVASIGACGIDPSVFGG